MVIFDSNINRKNTNSIKYDGLEKYFKVDLRNDPKNIKPLWVADMDFATPDFILNAIKEKLNQQILGYENTSPEFFDAVIYWQKRNGIKLKKENVVFSIGVVPSLSAAVRAFTNIDDKIIVQPPVYYPFFSCIKDNGRNVAFNPLINKNGKYVMDLSGFESLIDKKTKAFILCSPHNPVGRLWSEKELKNVGEICLKHNILIISDEIHSDLVFKPFTSTASLYPQNTLVLHSPTKTFNVAGLKTSYGFSLNKNIMNKFSLELKRSHFSLMNSFSNVATITAYSPQGELWLQQLLDYLKSNIDFTVRFLQKNLPAVSVFNNEATYLLWLDFNGLNISHDEIKVRLLNRAHVALNDGTSFGKEGAGFFRLNIALSKSELKASLQKISDEFS